MKTFILGRNPNVSFGEIPVKINDMTNKVSGNHCRITFDGINYFIEDLISTNGTFIDGIRISGKINIQIGSNIMLGGKHHFNINELPFNPHNYNHNSDQNYQNSTPNFSGRPLDISKLIHPKERTYLNIMYIFGGLFWITVVVVVVGVFISTVSSGILNFIGAELIFTGLFVLFYLALIALIIIIMNLFFEANLMQNSIKVTKNQYPDIYEILNQQARRLNITNIPKMFIYSSNGIVNAIAIRSLHNRYILLLSATVDLMLQRKKYNQLAFIIGHELGHHAAGHFSYFKRIFIKPAYIVPFLGAAYARAKEFTADRIGCALIDDIEDGQYALSSIASGSISLNDRTDIQNFVQQQDEVYEIVKFLSKLYSHYPSMTRRVEEIGKINLNDFN